MLLVCSIDLSGDGGEPASKSSLGVAFPPQLVNALFRLYHLRRGALISPGPMRSMDDRAETRGIFLRFPLEECISMMAPVLISTGSLEGVSPKSEAMQPVPPETLALWDSVSFFLPLINKSILDPVSHLLTKTCRFASFSRL